MKQVLLSGVLVVASGLALAKLPPPDDATKAKAAEAAAKQAWQAKVDALPAVQGAGQGRRPVQEEEAAQRAAPPSRRHPPPCGSPRLQRRPSRAGTPVTSAPLPPCADPGPFAYNPP